jgi:hypothetical protein
MELNMEDSKLCLPEHLLERKNTSKLVGSYALSCWTILQLMNTNVHERSELTSILTSTLTSTLTSRN